MWPELYHGDCLDIMPTLEQKVDGVLTSQPYNMGKNPWHGKAGSSLYNQYSDNLSDDEYIEMMLAVFYCFEDIVIDEGVVLMNMSYSSRNPILHHQLIMEVSHYTKFQLVDEFFWKKSHAIPFQTSPTHLSRIVEGVYVFARDNKKYRANKPSRVGKTGQMFFGYVDNFIEAPNHDKHSIKHSATFSIEFAKQCIEMYFPPLSRVLDPFMGLGTTGKACHMINRNFIGIEIDKKYFNYANQYLNTDLQWHFT